MNNLNYGVIGNCHTAALISQNGNIEWLCFPDFDSPSIFASLLDREKGGASLEANISVRACIWQPDKRQQTHIIPASRGHSLSE